jgi:hypothetical protein
MVFSFTSYGYSAIQKLHNNSVSDYMYCKTNKGLAKLNLESSDLSHVALKVQKCSYKEFFSK